jgi:hypothetical protein
MKRMIILALVIGFALSSASQAGVILLVSDDTYAHSRSGTGSEADFAAFLTGLGHTVHTSGPGQYKESNEGAAGAAVFAASNLVDLVIVSRSTNSGAYNNGAGWNGIDVPLILMGPHLSRSSRWKWVDNGSANTDPQATISIVAPADPFVVGLGDSYTAADGRATTNGALGAGTNGTAIANALDGRALLARWEAGTEFYAGSGQIPSATRVLLGGIPIHEDHGSIPMTFDHYTDNGKAIIAQTVNTLIPEPTTIALLGFGGLAMLRRKR